MNTYMLKHRTILNYDNVQLQQNKWYPQKCLLSYILFSRSEFTCT